MARAIARGIESSNVASSSIRTVHSDNYKESDDILVTKEDLKMFRNDNWQSHAFRKYGGSS